MRSLRSEFDYTHKKKFTDVIGNKGGRRSGNGLKRLSQGQKNLKDGASVKSGASRMSRSSKISQMHKRYNSIEHMESLNPI